MSAACMAIAYQLVVPLENLMRFVELVGNQNQDVSLVYGSHSTQAAFWVHLAASCLYIASCIFLVYHC